MEMLAHGVVVVEGVTLINMENPPAMAHSLLMNRCPEPWSGLLTRCVDVMKDVLLEDETRGVSA